MIELSIEQDRDQYQDNANDMVDNNKDHNDVI